MFVLKYMVWQDLSFLLFQPCLFKGHQNERYIIQIPINHKRKYLIGVHGLADDTSQVTWSSTLPLEQEMSSSCIVLNWKQKQMCHKVRKRSFGHGRPVKIQIRLRFRAVWSESSLGAFWISKQSFFMPTLKILIRLRGCVGWFESSLAINIP